MVGPGSVRRICYVSGTRADFGLMARTLLMAKESAHLDLSICVTGMHLSPLYGFTVREIRESGLRIAREIPVLMDGSSGAMMAKAIGQEIVGMVETFEAEKPDFVLLLGDRGEMLAGAVAAIHLNIPIIHIHGGERTGTVDEPIRHAISKLAHYHFVATHDARERLVHMGELPKNIFVTGAPGLDELLNITRRSKKELFQEVKLDETLPLALVVFHPVVQEASEAGRQIKQIMNAVLKANVQALCLMPNADAGGQSIREVLKTCVGASGIRIVTHLPRSEFISWMAVADVMVGNSSSGIIEAASLGLWAVNVGDRQHNRERSGNVIDVKPDERAVHSAILHALRVGRKSWTNIYGSGNAAEKIVQLLIELPIDNELLSKANAY